MYFLILFFLVMYPFCIFPWGADPYYTVPKSIYLTCFTFLLWIGYLMLSLKGRVRTKLTFVEGFVFCLLLLVSVSTIFSIDMNLSLVGTKDRYEGLLAWISYLTLFYFSYRFIDFHKRETIYFWVTISGALVSIYAILQHFLLDFFPRHSEKLLWTRSFGFFDNPNFYGTFTVILLLLVMTAFLETNHKPKLYFYYGAACIIFVSMIYSLTRSAWLGSFAGYIVLSFFVLKERSLWKKWIILAAGLALMFTVVNVAEENTAIDRAQSILSDSGRILEGDSHAGSSRYYIWKQSFPLLKDYYVTGSGPDTFGEVFPYDDEESKIYFGTENVYVDKAHNEYLQIAITLGIPALLVYLLVVFTGIIQLFSTKKKIANLHEDIYRWGLIAIISGYLIQAFFNISVITVAPYFWIILGFAYQFVQQKKIEI